jgi:hypothetical protein
MPTTSNTASDNEVTSDSETSNSSSSHGSMDSESEMEPIQLGGHPRETTAAYSLELRRKIEAATRESVSLLSDLQREMKWQGRRLRKGAIEVTISQAVAIHYVPPHVEIKIGTLMQRLKQKSTKGIQGQPRDYSTSKYANSNNSFARAATMQFNNLWHTVQRYSR